MIGKRHQEQCRRGFEEGLHFKRAGSQRFTQSKEGSSKAVVSSVNIWQLQNSEIILPSSKFRIWIWEGCQRHGNKEGMKFLHRIQNRQSNITIFFLPLNE